MSYSHKANVDTTTAGAAVTVPANTWVYSWAAASTAGGTVTITPAGGSAQDNIIVPANGGVGFTWPTGSETRPPRLGPGSTLTFTGTTSYVVVFA